MNTTELKNAIRTGEHTYTHSQTGLTKLLVAIPLGLRTSLAQLSAVSGFSQQEIIRQAVERIIDEGQVALVHNERTSKVASEAKAEREAERAERTAVRKQARFDKLQAMATAKAERAASREQAKAEREAGKAQILAEKTKAALEKIAAKAENEQPVALVPVVQAEVWSEPVKPADIGIQADSIEHVVDSITSRPSQPTPAHTWVVRGAGGYWRAKKGTTK